MRKNIGDMITSGVRDPSSRESLEDMGVLKIKVKPGMGNELSNHRAKGRGRHIIVFLMRDRGFILSKIEASEISRSFRDMMRDKKGVVIIVTRNI